LARAAVRTQITELRRMVNDRNAGIGQGGRVEPRA
jgi:hypothetical protein